MLLYVTQLIALLVVPGAFIFALWRGKEADRCRWLLKALYTGVLVAYIIKLGRWDFLSFYVRYLMALAWAAAALKSYLAVRTAPFIASDKPKRQWLAYAASVTLLLFFSGFLGWAWRAHVYPKNEAVDLSFPLHDVWAYVGQGGNSTSLNYHNDSHAQRYALDIVALNAFGVRARGLNPQELTRYVIYGAPVHSPCDGSVAAAVDGFVDQTPPNSDRDNVAGNHVVISCDGLLVLLAHLQPGSIHVREGQSVSRGTVVGLVGNSGNTSEPHLHVHAVRAGSGGVLKGSGVPLTFAGRFPVRNSTFR